MKHLSAIRIHWLVFAIVSSLTLVASDATRVVARDPIFRAQNYQLNYEECSGGGGGSSGSSGSSTPLEGSDNAQKVWNYFKSKGFSDEQTAAIMGNLAWESGDPSLNKTNSTDGRAVGIAQWQDSRLTGLKNAAQQQGRDMYDLQFQLEYLYNEMQTRTERDGGSKTEEQGLKGITDVAQATEYFMYNYERPGTPHLDKRVEYAKQYLEKYGTGDSSSSGGGGSSGPSGQTCNGGGGAGSSNAQCGEGGLIGTLKCYAWPEYRGNDINATEDYKKAIERAQGEGRYVGGTAYPGIDCGGFVTTLLYDSGYEPGYNYSARGGNTVSQYKWAKENWTVLGKGNEIDTAALRPGDVANDETTHTFLWVGQVNGFEPTNIASASWDERAPMAGHENPTEARWTWFGKR